MNSWGRAVRRGRGRLSLIVALLTVCLLLPGPTPAAAEVNAAFNVGVGVVGFLAASAIGYGLYETKMRPDQPRLLDGEFYGGAYLGASFATSQDLSYNGGAIFNDGIIKTATSKFKVSNNSFLPGVVGGLKFGYFFKSIPYLGLEGETNVSPNRVTSQNRRVGPPILGSTTVNMPDKDWINWTSALHIVGRYGFFKDSEVPFGRLQPYVGIGPAVVAMYDPEDSAKNFAIDAMAGIRFMMLKNVSAFLEYKYNHQFSPEMEIHQVVSNVSTGAGTATLPGYDLHRVIIGVTYHW